MIVKPITTNNAMTGPPTNPTAGDPLFVYNSENQMILLQFEKQTRFFSILNGNILFLLDI